MFYTWQIDDPEAHMPPPRRFPPPWSVEDIGAAFVVKDSSGQKLGYLYILDGGSKERTPMQEQPKIDWIDGTMPELTWNGDEGHVKFHPDWQRNSTRFMLDALEDWIIKLQDEYDRVEKAWKDGR
jgi:hypothetical protein